VVAQASGYSDHGARVEGCPVVQLRDDKADDVELLLEALYDWYDSLASPTSPTLTVSHIGPSTRRRANHSSCLR
jgi:hypothetical protein